MDKGEIKKEEAIAELEKVMFQILNGTFEGILVYSNVQRKAGFILAQKGFAEDRINAMDAIFHAIYEEPNAESRHWMVVEMHKRWKHYFPLL